MVRFDTQIQELKYKVLREVTRRGWTGEIYSPQGLIDIQKKIITAKTPTMRCCLYKERAVLLERIRLAMGGNAAIDNIVEVIDIGCDECPAGGYQVGNSCRGCIAHRCAEACKSGAITFDPSNANHSAQIDKSKCVECGRCANVCPYNAISDHKRPCEQACKIKAIDMDEDMVARIDNDACVSCGACIFQCPFGALMDKAHVLDMVDIINRKDEGGYKIYAVVAPAVAGQYGHDKLGKLVTAIKQLGFDEVVEAALGADIAAYNEAEELVEKGFLTSSCCPAFVKLVKNKFPNLADNVSTTLSPAACLVNEMKRNGVEGKFVFIGPCTAKKEEYAPEGPTAGYFDCVLGFDELQAMIDSKDIDLDSLEEDALNNATFYGRTFANSGGVANAVAQALKERGHEDFEFKPVVCTGLDECSVALLKASKGVLGGNFIEGMACIKGCIGGASCFNHGNKDSAEVVKYGNTAEKQTILEAVEGAKELS
ncbi:MAG: monomeric [FeFe] hydrogenase [Eubacteriales bacterium]|nr:monomeric [FeFe] hydrogenase [Eubacteriales bacterium]MDD4390534.1 monomeric [FeFe] hydrogenase [Eubacteriales bacterium]